MLQNISHMNDSIGDHSCRCIYLVYVAEMEMSEDHNLIFGANEMFHGRTNGLKMYHSKEEQENFAKIQEINEEGMCKSVENLLSERG